MAAGGPDRLSPCVLPRRSHDACTAPLWSACGQMLPWGALIARLTQSSGICSNCRSHLGWQRRRLAGKLIIKKGCFYFYLNGQCVIPTNPTNQWSRVLALQILHMLGFVSYKACSSLIFIWSPLACICCKIMNEMLISCRVMALHSCCVVVQQARLRCVLYWQSSWTCIACRSPWWQLWPDCNYFNLNTVLAPRLHRWSVAWCPTVYSKSV